ncbi:MAG: TldD/PmbA family protein [Conexivisphaerales archaeon]
MDRWTLHAVQWALPEEEVKKMYRERARALIGEKVDQYSIIEHRINERIIRFFNGSISLAATGSSTILHVYATVGKKSSMTVINSMADLEGQLKAFVSKINLGPDVDVAELPPRANYHFNGDADEQVDEEMMVASVKEAIHGAIDAGADRSAGIIRGNYHEIGIITSSGNEGVDRRTSYTINIRAFKGSASGSGISAFTRASAINAEDLGREAGKNSAISGNPHRLEDGQYDVLLSPNVSASIMELVGASASAFLAEIGMSFLKGMSGKTVTNGDLSLIDYGQVDGGVGSRAFDDEGAPTGTTEIIKSGTFNSYLHNSTTAKKWNTSTTGNAGIIEPGPWNLVIKGGRSTEEELLGSMKRGIMVTNNWYTRFNSYITGEFSTLIRDAAFYVEDGRIKYPVAGMRLSDSLPRLLQNIVSFTETTKWVKWWGEVSVPVKAPAILVSGSRISIV